mmetsp:Transcript_37379/g.93805  ORF Transcript_37379/g.93805 Transcript_37379/m.93805 type:complete len:116 (-) Transcript_37379:100-447(-)
MTMLTDVTRESPKTNTSKVQGIGDWLGSLAPSVASTLPLVVALCNDMEQMSAAQDAEHTAHKAKMAAQDAKHAALEKKGAAQAEEMHWMATILSEVQQQMKSMEAEWKTNKSKLD